jgi:hypothetical protein
MNKYFEVLGEQAVPEVDSLSTQRFLMATKYYRPFFCGPAARNDVSYSPRDWLVRAFAPVCAVWRMAKGLAAPVKNRLETSQK